jgi:hypothetical protein
MKHEGGIGTRPRVSIFGLATRARYPAQAELIVYLANLGVSGEVKLPADTGPCFQLLDRVNVRLDKALARFRELAESRTSDERVREQLAEVLERWFVSGREATKTGAPTIDSEHVPEE